MARRSEAVTLWGAGFGVGFVGSGSGVGRRQVEPGGCFKEIGGMGGVVNPNPTGSPPQTDMDPVVLGVHSKGSRGS